VFEIKPASIGDCEGLGRLHVAAWRETYAELLPAPLLAALSEGLRAEQWRRALAGAPAVTLLLAAEAAGGLVGFGAAGPPRDGSLAEDSELYALYLLRAAQGQGLGRRLLGAIAGRLAAAGRRSLGLWVLRENLAARRFYERLGGVVGAERNEPLGGGEIAEIAYAWRDVTTLRGPLP
jgi:ribosomal protein S18 acetylase RimI-like enzyme